MMKKSLILLSLFILLGSSASAAESWIRVNLLGYLPEGNKKALYISESELKISNFTIHDALTDEPLITLDAGESFGAFDRFNGNYELDFSTFKDEGAFYIKIGNTYSPILYINQNIYTGSTDKLIEFMQTKPGDQDWNNLSVKATAIFELLFSYRQNPTIFGDQFDIERKNKPNGIPDILDDVKWKLDEIINENHPLTTASLAGKLAATFAFGADILSNVYPSSVGSLQQKAVEIYQTAKNNIIIPVPASGLQSENTAEEENWKDDMQLAATQLYFLTYEQEYLKDAVDFGAAEPVPQWLFTLCDQPFAFYPYINWAPMQLSQIEHPLIKKNYVQNIYITLLRAQMIARENPFHVGVHFSHHSNYKMVALHNLCHIYRNHTGDNSFIEMEEAMSDWIFGRNPWGVSMVSGFPVSGQEPRNLHSGPVSENGKYIDGGLVSGAVSKYCLDQQGSEIPISSMQFERFQTDWAFYAESIKDAPANQPTLDGTASLTHLLSARQAKGKKQDFFDNNTYDRGGINRFNPEKKQIALIFSGHQYSDGYRKIKAALDKQKINAAFFFSGDFLRRTKNKQIIKNLLKKGHYVGPATNHFEPLAQWENPDFVRTRKKAFLLDLKENYAALKKNGISKQQAPFFNPPFELYNDSISKWCKEVGIYTVRSTPGSYSNLDYTFPEMRENYYSTKEIIDQIMRIETNQGLNGYILQFNFGTNPGRKDKLYNVLSTMLGNLQKQGYEFVDLYTATGVVSQPEIPLKSKKKKP
jgi:peptidoglycan/xylan/chitin deacetylase (PgdA/CDA1 family)